MTQLLWKENWSSHCLLSCLTSWIPSPLREVGRDLLLLIGQLRTKWKEPYKCKWIPTCSSEAASKYLQRKQPNTIVLCWGILMPEQNCPLHAWAHQNKSELFLLPHWRISLPVSTQASMLEPQEGFFLLLTSTSKGRSHPVLPMDLSGTLKTSGLAECLRMSALLC